VLAGVVLWGARLAVSRRRVRRTAVAAGVVLPVVSVALRWRVAVLVLAGVVLVTARIAGRCRMAVLVLPGVALVPRLDVSRWRVVVMPLVSVLLTLLRLAVSRRTRSKRAVIAGVVLLLTSVAWR